MQEDTRRIKNASHRVKFACDGKDRMFFDVPDVKMTAPAESPLPQRQGGLLPPQGGGGWDAPPPVDGGGGVGGLPAVLTTSC